MTDRSDSVLDRALLILFALFVFGSVFSISIAQTLMIISLALFIVIALRSRHIILPPMRSFYFWAALFTGWQVIAALAGPTPVQSLWLVREEWLFAIVAISVYLCRSQKNRLILVTALAVGIVIISPYALYQYIAGGTVFTSDDLRPAPQFGYRIGGSFGDITFGNYMAVAASFLAALGFVSRSWLQRERWLLISIAAGLAGLMTILTFGRSAVAAMFLTLIILLIILGRKYWKATAAVVALLVVFAVAIPGMGDRFVNRFEMEKMAIHVGSRIFIWKNSLNMLARHPLVGVAPGNFEAAYSQQLPANVHPSAGVSTAHNDILTLAVNTGIPGGIAFVALWIVVLKTLWSGFLRAKKTGSSREEAVILAAFCGSICFFMTSMFHATFFDDEVRHLLMFLWGIGMAAQLSVSKLPAETSTRL